jgi:hypothetical protein
VPARTAVAATVTQVQRLAVDAAVAAGDDGSLRPRPNKRSIGTQRRQAGRHKSVPTNSP